LMDLILSPLKTAAAQGAENLASGIGTAVQLGLTLYIILYGWQVARGEIAEPWNEFAKRAVKLGIIVALIQGTGLYREYVIDFLAGSLPDSLSNALSNKPIPDASAFDSLANQVAILLTEVWQGTGWSAPAATARAAVVTLLVMPFLWCALIVGFVVTMWAKAGMYFVATLGPLFIALAMFDQTRKYLHNWLDQIVTQIALQVLVALTCGLVMQGLENATKVAPTPDSIFALAGHVIVLALFSIAIWSSLPRLAAKLGGYGASLAGAGSRAALFDTMRAPFASFNEHGAPSPGRPELAAILPRGGDSRQSAPIMPPPVIPPDGRGGPVPAANEPAGRSGWQTGPDTTRPSAGIRPADAPASSTPTSSSVPTSGFTAASFGGPVNTPHDLVSDAASGGLASSLPRPDASYTPSAAARPTDAVPQSAPDSDFDSMLAEQRTGFEGMTFETSPPPS
jgi:type IV secretion system protein VirB6